MSSYTDTWATASSSSASAAQLPSPQTTPSKRASRSSRISNDIDHSAFTRTTSSTGTSETYKVGDVVLVNEHAKLKQRFLAPPPYQLAPKAAKGKSRAKQQQQQQQAEAYDGWKHEDGLQAGDKVAVITRLFEDVKGRKVALVRWFARPGAVWGPDGPEEEEEQVEPYELYYTSDSTHLHEQRVMRARAASNPFTSSPSSSPTKSSSRSYSSPSRFSSTMLSSSAAFRTPQHSDPIPISTITQHVRIVSSPPSASDQACGTTPIPTFYVRRVYDVKPVPGASFWGELDWEEVRERGVGRYEEIGKEGAQGREEAREGWDVEAVMEEEEEEEEEVVVKPRKGKGKKVEQKKGKVGKEKKEKVVRMVLSDGEESSDDDGEEEDTFDPRSHRSDASSDEDGSDGEQTASGSGSEDEDDDMASDSDDGFPRTPTKRGRGARTTRQLPTPSSSAAKKRGRPASSSTSTAKTAGRAAKRRRFASNKKTSTTGNTLEAHNPLPPLLSASRLSTLTPFERAKALLHVSATPESLPCREEQREEIRQFLGDAILGRTGGCLYVHGVPGTGKTATVHSVVRELQADEDMDAFTFVEINGMKISEPMAAFSHLWSALSAAETSSTTSTSTTSSPRKLSPRAALTALGSHFSNPSPSRRTTVVLVDELDQMLTKRQDVLYNFFNWPHVPHSRLVVVAVANTMDLPERELSGKIRSRLGTNRIPFQPYTWTELKRILEARLSLVNDPSSTSSKSKSTTPLFDDVALQKIAKSVAGISGDARKALDVARRTLDRVALRLAKEGKSVDGKDGKGVRCTIQEATQAYNDMTRQGPAVFVRRLSVMGKVLLLAVAQCVKRAGVPEVEVDTVLTWHLDFLRQTSLLSSPLPASSTATSTISSSSPISPPTKDELLTLLSHLHALRLIATENQRLDVFQRVRAGVDEGDLFAALREDEVLGRHVPKVA